MDLFSFFFYQKFKPTDSEDINWNKPLNIKTVPQLKYDLNNFSNGFLLLINITLFILEDLCPIFLQNKINTQRRSLK